MKKTMVDVLRRAIKKSGLTARQLAAIVDLPQATVSEFLRGRDMRLSRAQKLADYFGLELRPAERHKRRP